MSNKFIKIGFTLTILSSLLFVFVPNVHAGQDGTGFVTRHETMEPGRSTSFPWAYTNFTRNDYIDSYVDFSIYGHRHGASQIDVTVCIIANPGTSACQYMGCSGNVCGAELGGGDVPQHPKSYRFGSNFGHGAGSPSGSSFQIATDVTTLDDAEVWVDFTAIANYDSSPPPPPPPTGGQATVACVVHSGTTSGPPISGANCSLSNPVQSGTTNTSGYRAFNNVVLGSQTLNVTKSGYSSYVNGVQNITGNYDWHVALTPTPPAGQYALNVTKSGTGNGTVTGTGINCGSDCSQNFASGNVTLTATAAATPAPGSTFAGWSGAGCSGTGTCTVSMTANRNVTATFNSTTPACVDNANTVYTIAPPATVTPGQSFPISVTTTNTGTTRIYHGSAYSLRQVSAIPIINNVQGGIDYGHAQSANLSPGGSWTWDFIVTPPSTPGTYSLDLRMLHHAAWNYRLPNGTVCGGNAPADIFYGTTATADFTVADPTPSVDSVSINSSVVVPNGSTPYTITIVGSNPIGGGANMSHQYVLINQQGTNAGQHRGYLTWYWDGGYTGWDVGKNKMLCAGGGIAAIQNAALGNGIYGDSYIHMDSCSTSVSGNTRTVNFNVRFDPTFTTPLTNNDIAGLVYSSALYNSPWVNFDTNFSLSPPTTPAPPVVTISSPSVIPNNTTPYTITARVTDLGGGSKVVHSYALINLEGTNAGQYRGYLTWSLPNNWTLGKNYMACTGGGYAVIQNNAATAGHDVYGPQYLNMDSCSTSVSGNIRTTAFNVRFAPIFTTPLTQNDLSGWALNSDGNATGWVNSNNDFSLTLQPPSTPTVTGPTTGLINTSYTYNASSTDPNNYRVRLGFDWNDDNTVDVWVPAAPAYVNSGVTQSASQSWPTVGAKNFKVKAVNEYGVESGWRGYANDIIPPPPVYNLTHNGNQTITKSSSGSVTANGSIVSKTLVSGTAVPVTLSVGLPAAIAGVVIPTITNNSPGTAPANPCTGTCQNPISFSVPSNAQTGTHTITLTGNPAASGPSSFTLTINPAPVGPVYNLSNDGNQTVSKSGSSNVAVNSTITRTLVSGTPVPVTIVASGLPTGVTPSYTNNPSNPANPCTGSCQSVITFTITPAAPVGTHTITVTGNPAATSPTTFTITINPPAIGTVTCSANPATALIGQTVTWTAVPSGGTPPYTYSWSGTNIPTSPAPNTASFNIVYSTIGIKTANVVVNDAGGSAPANCQASPTPNARIIIDPNSGEF